MKKLILFLALGSYSLQAQPGAEIFLYEISKGKNGYLQISNPVNVTQHPGYDNQPHFDSKGSKLYYSSFNDDGRSDIRVYDLKTKKTSAFTSTSEREYSPTLTPDKKFISCIIQRDNNAQDLGKYPVKGGQPIVLIDNLIVGYHAWVDDDRVLIFVLGEPNSLQLYNVKTKESKVLAQGIGRSLHKIPKENAMSFVKKNADIDWQIMRWDVKTESITPIIATLPGREDLSWTALGEIVMSDGKSIFAVNPKSEKEWREVNFVNGKDMLKGATRITVSPDGKYLAIVVAE